jgi:DUF4097 and DUF4098 domain-containing protein YvlB
MKATTRRVAVFLTCVAVATSAAAQDTNSNQDGNTKVEQRSERVLRQRAVNEARRQAEAQRRAAARGRSEADITEAFSQTVRLVPGGTFDLQNVAGDITITGGAATDARIEAVKRVRDTVAARARATIAQTRIEISERGGNVEVRTFHPRVPSRISVDYTITLPENVNVILRSSSGNLHVQSLSGDEVVANTLSGSIVLRDLVSRILDLHTISGDMQLHDIAARRAFLQSTLGNLEYAGRLLPTGRYRLQTHRGNIRFQPSGDPGFDLEAMTFSGELRSDFVLKMPRPIQRTGRGAEKVLRGTVGNPAATVTASTFSGNVVIIKPE